MTAEPTAGTDPAALESTDLQPSLGGVWVNQLGSRLELEVETDGHLGGRYRSGVGDGSEVHPLSGWSDPPDPGGRGVLGFAVHWPATRAVSVWAGQHDPERGVIEATWLLVGETAPGDAWRATTLGHDEFHREGPGA